MLNQAADPNTTDQSGKTALMMAIELEYVQWGELLMEHGPISINKTTQVQQPFCYWLATRATQTENTDSK